MCRSMVDIQSPTAEIRRGKKKKKEEGKKLQDENIYGLPITQGDHNKVNLICLTNTQVKAKCELDLAL